MPVLSSLTGSVSVASSGQIIYSISPLHADGRYLKNINNESVWLRGVNAWSFVDYPAGVFMGSPVWNINNVNAELTEMKNWGINTVRIATAIEFWKYNMSTPSAGIGHRAAIKLLLNAMAAKGMYLIYAGYSVRGYWNGMDQDPLPYPPYQTSANAPQVIGSQQDFVDWWKSIASELKGYPNVIFELWNEPNGDDAAMNSWYNVMQLCINAIRSTGAIQPIICTSDMACWVNLNYPPPQNDASTMDWIWSVNLADPLNNIIYSTHYYTTYGHIGLNGKHVYDYNNIKLGFTYFKFPEVLQNHPLFIGEFAANMDTDVSNELVAFNNTLTIFREWHIHYTAWLWRDALFGRLYTGNFNPTLGGSMLKSHLALPAQ